MESIEEYKRKLNAHESKIIEQLIQENVNFTVTLLARMLINFFSRTENKEKFMSEMSKCWDHYTDE